MSPREVDEAGSATSVLASGVAYLQPEDAVLEAMFEGWAAQQRSRRLAATTVENRAHVVRRFVDFTNDYPWRWAPADAEAWTSSLVEAGMAHSTIRNYQAAIATFLGYACDTRYGWSAICSERFGEAPAQVFHEWNSAIHKLDSEGRPENRPLTRGELQDLFDYADERVGDAERLGRKGWLAAFRDAVLLKTTYAFGLRRREVAMLELADFGKNPRAPEFGPYGVCSVRYGKAAKGSPPRQRSVLTVMGWSAATLTEWVEHIRPAYGAGAGTTLWPTERGGRLSVTAVNARFASYRDALGLDPVLSPHCLRYSYITHLLEDGFDQLFVQSQVGHRWGSSTAGYTKVGSDFLQAALARALRPALGETH